MSNPGKSPVTPKRLKQAVLSFKTIAPDENKRKRLNNDNTSEQNIKIPRISLQCLSSDGIQSHVATISDDELQHFLNSSSVCDASRIDANECDASEIKKEKCDNLEAGKNAHKCDLADTKMQESGAAIEELKSDKGEIDFIRGEEITSTSKMLFSNVNENIKDDNLASSQPQIEPDSSLNDCNCENTNVSSQSQSEIYYTPEDCKSEEIKKNFSSEDCNAIKMEVTSLSELDSSLGDCKFDKEKLGTQPSPDGNLPSSEDMNSSILKPEESVNRESSSPSLEQNSKDVTAIICKTPTTGNVKKKTLTPKQQERENKRQEERRQKEEEKRKIAEEKIRLKNEEKRKKEEERKRKEEEENRIKEEKRKLKEEEKKQKEEEKKRKEEEKLKKEEERLRLKEEERKRKEEEQLLKEEEKMSKKLQEEKSLEKSKALLTSFLRVKPKTISEKMDVCVSQESAYSNNDTGNNFMPFQLKKGMKLAITNRATLGNERLQTLDTILAGDCDGQQMQLYLSQLKSPSYKAGCCPNTEFNTDENDDVIIVDENDGEVVIKKEDSKFGKYRWKLLQFEENRRPAYWGTWRKRSKFVTGRKPFARDKDLLDYEFDSDEEWEDETEGESLAGSDEDKESDDDYEVDNSFFVPHGYLSDEEQDPDTEDLVPPEEQGIRLKQLEEKFKTEHSQKTHKLKPRIYYVSTKCDSSNKASIALNKLLTFSAIYEPTLLEQPIKIDFGDSRSTASSPTDSNKSTSKNKLTEFPDALVADLIKLAHGNKTIRSIVDEFVDFCRKLDTPVRLSKVCVERKVKEISTYTRPTHDENAFSYGYCWYVNDDIRAKHGLENLSYSNNSSQSSSKANIQCTPTSLLGFAVTLPPFSVSPSTQVQPPPHPPTPSAVTPPPPPRSKTTILNFATVLTPKLTSVNCDEPVNRSCPKEVSEEKGILGNFKEIAGVESLGSAASKLEVVEKVCEQKSQSKVATSVSSPSTPAVPVVKKRVTLTRVG